MTYEEKLALWEQVCELIDKMAEGRENTEAVTEALANVGVELGL